MTRAAIRRSSATPPGEEMKMLMSRIAKPK
jgi:hypothetical protein